MRGRAAFARHADEEYKDDLMGSLTCTGVCSEDGRLLFVACFRTMADDRARGGPRVRGLGNTDELNCIETGFIERKYPTDGIYQHEPLPTMLGLCQK